MVNDGLYGAITMPFSCSGLMTMGYQLALLSGDVIHSLMRRSSHYWLLLKTPSLGTTAHQSGSYDSFLCPSRHPRLTAYLANPACGKVLRPLFHPQGGTASEKTVVHAPANRQNISWQNCLR